MPGLVSKALPCYNSWYAPSGIQDSGWWHAQWFPSRSLWCTVLGESHTCSTMNLGLYTLLPMIPFLSFLSLWFLSLCSYHGPFFSCVVCLERKSISFSFMLVIPCDWIKLQGKAVKEKKRTKNVMKIPSYILDHRVYFPQFLWSKRRTFSQF